MSVIKRTNVLELAHAQGFTKVKPDFLICLDQIVEQNVKKILQSLYATIGNKTLSQETLETVLDLIKNLSGSNSVVFLSELNKNIAPEDKARSEELSGEADININSLIDPDELSEVVRRVRK